MKDIAIVGGGPAGCRLAMLLAEDHDVVLIEKRGIIGEPVQCAGLVSHRSVDDVTKPSIVREIGDLILHSPSDIRLALHSASPKGVVIDRSIYDSALSAIAGDRGAEIFLRTQVTSLKVEDESVSLFCKNPRGTQEIRAKIAVGMDGPRSVIREMVTDEPFGIIYRGAQIEGKLRDDQNPDAVEIWLGSEVAPGFFAWKIPAGDITRIGLATSSDEAPTSLLRDFAKSRFAGIKVESRQAGLIPVGPLGRQTSGRLALAGDAAGQTKPLTGGGIYLGKRAAELLSASISAEGLVPEALRSYERAFREEFEHELSRSWLIRRVLNKLSDRKLDRAIEVLSDGSVVKTLEESGDIDFQTGLSSVILRKAPKLITFAPELLKGLASEK